MGLPSLAGASDKVIIFTSSHWNEAQPKILGLPRAVILTPCSLLEPRWLTAAGFFQFASIRFCNVVILRREMLHLIELQGCLRYFGKRPATIIFDSVRCRGELLVVFDSYCERIDVCIPRINRLCTRCLIYLRGSAATAVVNRAVVRMEEMKYLGSSHSWRDGGPDGRARLPNGIAEAELNVRRAVRVSDLFEPSLQEMIRKNAAAGVGTCPTEYSLRCYQRMRDDS